MIINPVPQLYDEYLPGSYYPLWEGDSAGQVWQAANTIYFYRYRLKRDLTFTALKARAIGSTASTNAKLACWSDSVVSHRPLTLLFADNTQRSTAVAGDVQFTTGSHTYLAGTALWFGLKSDNNTENMLCTAALNMKEAANYGLSSTLNGLTPSLAHAFATAFADIPEGQTFAWVQSGVPIVGAVT